MRPCRGLANRGLYLDVSRASACYNPAHGGGYFDPVRKRRVPTVNVFGTRDLFKRTYTFLKGKKREGLFCAAYVQRARRRAYLFVSNWNREAVSGVVTLDVDKLGFSPTRVVLQAPLGTFEETVKVSPRIEVRVPARHLMAIALSE